MKTDRFIYNLTFPVEASRLDRLVAWLRSDMIPGLTAVGASDPRLALVDNAGRECLESISLQLEFDSEADFTRWEGEILPDWLERYSQEMAPDALFFGTLLRRLPL